MLIDVNRPLSLETLVERVWGATPPSQASAALYSYISRDRMTTSLTTDGPARLTAP
ncbi:hypothetical protein ACWFR5_38770 [Streptomyces sp. NPDC055092]